MVTFLAANTCYNIRETTDGLLLFTKDDDYAVYVNTVIFFDHSQVIERWPLFMDWDAFDQAYGPE
jgi:hypothetical protein